jgi:hypothetical protein
MFRRNVLPASFLQNAGSYKSHTASHPRRWHSSVPRQGQKRIAGECEQLEAGTRGLRDSRPRGLSVCCSKLSSVRTIKSVTVNCDVKVQVAKKSGYQSQPTHLYSHITTLECDNIWVYGLTLFHPWHNVGQTEILLRRLFMLVLTTIMILIDLSVCVLQHNAKAVTWKFSKCETEKLILLIMSLLSLLQNRVG